MKNDSSFGRVGGRLAVLVVAASLSAGAMADDHAKVADSSSGVVGWVRGVGRAVGMAFRDIGVEGKRVGLAIGQTAASFGKDIGQGAASAGKEVGQAAKDGGRAIGRAFTGKGSADKANSSADGSSGG